MATISYFVYGGWIFLLSSHSCQGRLTDFGFHLKSTEICPLCCQIFWPWFEYYEDIFWLILCSTMQMRWKLFFAENYLFWWSAGRAKTVQGKRTRKRQQSRIMTFVCLLFPVGAISSRICFDWWKVLTELRIVRLLLLKYEKHQREISQFFDCQQLLWQRHCLAICSDPNYSETSKLVW